jgi:hypothetical protein
MKTLERIFIKGVEGFINLFAEPGKQRENTSSKTILGTVANLYYPERYEKALLDDEHRLNHIYILGGTGHGKTKLIEYIVKQDVLNNNGFMVIDFHGDLIRNLLCFLTEKYYPQDLDEIGQRLILIEPFNEDWVAGCNLLETAGASFSSILELVEAFEKFWGNNFWGPRMTELLRTVLITLADNDLTLLEARPLLTNEDFRRGLINNIHFRETRDYWIYRFNPLSEKMKSTYREPVLNRMSAFVTDPAIYRFFGQRERTINFRQAMDEGKWILLNLSKGQLKGNLRGLGMMFFNLRLLGMLFLTKIKQAALSRADVPENERRSFYVFMDEVQSLNFFSDDVEKILSQSRKFKLGLTMAHQNLDQLPIELRASILANARTDIFFRLSHHDASRISSEMDRKERLPIERKLVDLKVAEAFLKVKGQRPRLLRIPYMPSIRVSEEAIAEIRRASFQSWSNPVYEIEKEIEERRKLFLDPETLSDDLVESSIMFSKDYPALMPGNIYEEGFDDW